MSPSETDSTPSLSSRFLPRTFVTPKVQSLQTRYLEGDAAARAVLAQLRAATAGDPAAAWGISEYLLPEREYAPSMLRSGTTQTESADFAETAIHMAMTSYATMQQAKGEPMHVSKRSLGTAARLLGSNSDEPMDRGKVWERLSRLAQAQTVPGLRWQLRSFISLLKRRGIGLDFGKLADDLYFWQLPSSRITTQRAWSRAFFNSVQTETQKPESSETTSAE